MAKLNTSTQCCLQHFKNDPTLSNKLEELLGRLQEEPLLTASEKSSVTELCHIYESQKNTVEELIPIMKLKLTKEIPHLVRNSKTKCLQG